MFTYLFTFLFTWKVLRDLKLDLNLESVAGFKFGFEFGLKLNLNWNFEVFLKKCLGSPRLLDSSIRGFLFIGGLNQRYKHMLSSVSTGFQ